jgi:branched-chain amino acid transport system ATP-binding protein
VAQKEGGGAAMSDIVLTTRDIAVSFGGVKAADGVNTEIYRGEFLAIIGPNGSGKTTFLNLCTGYVKPHAGKVIFEGQDITGLSPRRITQRGIARAFQIPQMFMDHTLIENVLMAVAAKSGFWDWYTPLDRPSYRESAIKILDLVGLVDVKDQSVVELPEGMRKLADIALALALRPTLLLLDEPTSGVSASEKFELMEILTRVLKEEQITTVVVEHDMDLVRRYAHRVLVWDQGHVMASGEASEILNDPRVLKNVVGVD